MSDNEIEDVSESSFENLLNLKNLYLGGNELKTIPAEIFETLPNLQNISLEANKLQNIDRNIFRENPSLQNIWLNDNKIRNVNPSTFENLRSLEYLDLRGNECINKYFAESLLVDLKSELAKKCLENDVVVEEVTFRPDTKPSIPRKPKVDEKISSPKEIPCLLDYADWPNENGTLEKLYTCTIKEQFIDNPSDLIKPSPYATYVQGIRFDNNKKMTELPRMSFPNLLHFSAKNTSLTSINPEKFEDLEKLKGKFYGFWGENFVFETLEYRNKTKLNQTFFFPSTRLV